MHTAHSASSGTVTRGSELRYSLDVGTPLQKIIKK